MNSRRNQSICQLQYFNNSSCQLVAASNSIWRHAHFLFKAWHLVCCLSVVSSSWESSDDKRLIFLTNLVHWNTSWPSWKSIEILSPIVLDFLLIYSAAASIMLLYSHSCRSSMGSLLSVVIFTMDHLSINRLLEDSFTKAANSCHRSSNALLPLAFKLQMMC